jgi:chromosome segregation ATPase
MPISKYSVDIIKKRIDELRPVIEDIELHIKEYVSQIDKLQAERNKWEQKKQSLLNEIKEIKKDANIKEVSYGSVPDIPS